MSLSTGTGLSRTVVVGFMLSFVGAKGCWGFGGNVSLGDDEGGSGGQANGIAGSSSGKAGSAAGTAGSAASVAGSPDSSAGTGDSAGDSNSGAGTAGSNGVVTGHSPPSPSLTVSENGQVSNPLDEVAGSLYSASDGVSADGSNPGGGDCELAGHLPAECAAVTTPAYSAPGVLNWSAAGLICTSGTVERVLDLTSTPGTPDYASMWGAAIGFDFQEQNAHAAPYDAPAHGVIGIAFDIDVVPSTGLRVELLTKAVQNEPAAWKASAFGGSYASQLVAGHNVVLFQDVKPLPFYDVQTAFDPTQLLAVQFHIPTTTSSPAAYSYCISNLSLVLAE